MKEKKLDKHVIKNEEKDKKITDDISISKNELKISKKFIIFGVLIILIASYFVITNYYKRSESIAAKVNGEIITIEELDKAYNSLPEQYKTLIDKKDLLDQLIQAKVFYLEAEKRGIIVDKDEAKKMFDDIKDVSGLSDEEFAENIAKQGINEEELIESYSKQLTLQKFLDENLLNKIEITDENVKKYYDDNIVQFKLDEQVVVRHILIGDSNMTKEEKNSKAKELLKNINKDNFCDYVKNYSSDIASVDNCGEYKFTKKDPFVEEFKDLSFNQNVGQIGIVDTQYGTHIIWTAEKIPAKTLKFDEVKDKIKDFLKNQEARNLYKGFYDEIAVNYKIEIIYTGEK